MMNKRNLTVATGVALLSIAATACNGGSDSQALGALQDAGAGSSTSTTLQPEGIPQALAPVDTTSDPMSPTAQPKPARSYQTDALLFVGSGTWGTEVAALQELMDQHGMTYKSVTSAQLNAMTVDEIAEFGMIVWPGGSGGTQAGSLTSQTHSRLREAVQQRGVNYIGFCAGAFVAVAPAPAPGGDVSYGLGIVDGPELDYYYLENQGTAFAMTMATFADGSKRDLVWYGGPVTPRISGGVVAEYPNGDPMISEMWSGSGFVMLSAVHPAAPMSIRSEFGVTDADGVDTELAYQLLQATLHQQPLQAY